MSRIRRQPPPTPFPYTTLFRSWNGGLRTTPYFKNMIGLLTETIGHPTPLEIPFIPRTQLPSADYPLPVEPGPWHFRQSVRSEEHTSELQSRPHLVCRLLLEKKN